VINTNLPPVLHHFQDIAFDRSKIAIFGYPSCVLNPPTEGFPWDDLRKIFRGCQGMAKVLNGIETLQKISTGLSRVHEHYSQTDDTQMGRATAYSEFTVTNKTAHCGRPA